MHDVIKAAREAVAGLISSIDDTAKISQCRVCYHLFGPAGESIDNNHADFCWIGKLAAAVAEFDRPSAMEPGSVVYRTGRLTTEDYNEAISDLRLAKGQLADMAEGRGAPNGCAICEDGDHTAESCHHNPLVLARRWAAARRVTCCYHCGYIAYTDEEARDHFGRHDDEVAKCLTIEAEGIIRTKLAKLAFDFYTRRIGELMHQAEHWAMPDHEHPLAVHHRVQAAEECYQAIVAFDTARLANGYPEAFRAMEDALSRPPVNQPGAWPPSAELHNYRGARFVVARLDALKAKGEDRG